MYNTEGRLRRLLGLPVNDGRIVRPADEPTTAEFLPNWRTSLVEALTRRVELRKQKWNIKSLEFQLEAAKSLTNPRLDLVSRFQVNGFGDQLFGKSNDGPQGVGAAPFPSQTTASFYENLLNGNQTGYGIGVEYSMPIGFRAAHSQVRNLELRLAKARAALGAQEFEVSHELANAFRQADTTFQTAQTYFNRRRAAERRVQANEAQYRAGKGSVDLLLRAQVSLATAEKAYYQAVVGYNRAILDMKFRKGTLMEDHNVFLSESLSHPEAYTQAVRHAWARSHAFDANHLDTQPEEFATDESDPVELGPTVYSSSLGSGLTQPPAPEPVPSVELPATELKPLPKPEPIPEPAAPAPPVKKSFPIQVPLTHTNLAKCNLPQVKARLYRPLRLRLSRLNFRQNRLTDSLRFVKHVRRTMLSKNPSAIRGSRLPRCWRSTTKVTRTMRWRQIGSRIHFVGDLNSNPEI